MNTERKNFRYKNIFLVGSLLHSGNVIEYFVEHSERLVVFYLLRTLKDRKDFVQIYKEGRLVEERNLNISKALLMYYIFIYFWYVKTIFSNFGSNEKFYVITFHPVFFLFNSILRLFRKFEIVFWIIDYLPSPSFLFRIYQYLIFYYCKKNTHNLYLSDEINKIMNGSIKNNAYQKTVMWGVKQEKYITRKSSKKITLGFIGVIRRSHGLDFVFNLLKEHKDVYLKILGECEDRLYDEYQSLIKKFNIESQVLFPNTFFPTDTLQKELASCTIGVALYRIDTKDPICYTDSGKVKTYTQFGLPVIISNTSSIVPFIKKYHAGEIVKRNTASIYKAIVEITQAYSFYLRGVEKFNAHFDYQKYYKNAFAFLKKD